MSRLPFKSRVFPAASNTWVGPHARRYFMWTGEFRPPRKGEWYISGADPEAYQSFAGLDSPYHIAHPIVGDATHGKGAHNRAVAQFLGLQRLWLHALELRLTHPVTGAPLLIQSAPGPEWAPLLDDAGPVFEAARAEQVQAPPLRIRTPGVTRTERIQDSN